MTVEGTCVLCSVCACVRLYLSICVFVFVCLCCISGIPASKQPPPPFWQAPPGLVCVCALCIKVFLLYVIFYSQVKRRYMTWHRDPPSWRAPPGLWFRTEGARSQSTLAKHLLQQMDTRRRPKSISLENPNTLLVGIIIKTFLSINMICRLVLVACSLSPSIFKSSMGTMTFETVASGLCLVVTPSIACT